MFGFSIGEILLLAAIALIVIGPKQLPEFARQIGKILNEIKRASGQFSQEIKSQAQAEFHKAPPPVPEPEPSALTPPEPKPKDPV